MLRLRDLANDKDVVQDSNDKTHFNSVILGMIYAPSPHFLLLLASWKTQKPKKL